MKSNANANAVGQVRHFNGLHNMWETAVENTEMMVELRHLQHSLSANVFNQGGP